MLSENLTIKQMLFILVGLIMAFAGVLRLLNSEMEKQTQDMKKKEAEQEAAGYIEFDTKVVKIHYANISVIELDSHDGKNLTSLGSGVGLLCAIQLPELLLVAY